MLARTLNLLLGSWLVVSAFAWPHSHAEATNTVVVGIVCFVVSLAAVAWPPARRWNVLVGAWLFASTVFVPHGAATGLHNALAGIAMIGLALVRTPGWHRPVTLEERLREVADAIAHAPPPPPPPPTRR